MKRTLILSNHVGVAKLTLGKLVKRLRRAARPTTKRYINRDGKPAYQGTKRLKASQPLSSILVVLNKRHVHPNQSKGLLSSGFPNGCKSNFDVQNKVPDHTRSIPSFHNSVPYLFEGSVSYLCSIPLIHTLRYMSAYMQENVYYAQALWLCWQVCACSTYSCYLLCCVMVGVCLAAASWQSKNGLLVTLPPSQHVAGLCLHHLQLLPAVAQLWCLMVEMCLAAASWQSKMFRSSWGK